MVVLGYLSVLGVAHLVVHGTSSSISYETIPSVRLETSRGVLSTVGMVMQRRDGPRQLLDEDDDVYSVNNTVENMVTSDSSGGH